MSGMKSYLKQFLVVHILMTDDWWVYTNKTNIIILWISK